MGTTAFRHGAGGRCEPYDATVLGSGANTAPRDATQLCQALTAANRRESPLHPALQPNYGYALLEALESKGHGRRQHAVPPASPAREAGLLTSEWNTEESRPRKFYVASDEGAALADALVREWNELHGALKALKDGS